MKYRVHSAHPIVMTVEAKTDKGTIVPGSLPGLEVELLPADGEGKTVTLQITEENFTGLDPVELFAVDNVVGIGFTLIEKAPAKVEA